jgi:hypothetical protein
MWIRAGAAIWGQCGFGRVLRSGNNVDSAGAAIWGQCGFGGCCDLGTMWIRRVLRSGDNANLGRRRQGSGGGRGASVMSLSAQDRERFSAYPVLAWHRPSQWQGWCQARTDRRALSIGLGTPLQGGVCLSPGLASVFAHDALCSQIRSLLAPFFCKAYGLGLALARRKVEVAHRIENIENSGLARI